ncbi:MAG TPA: Asp-tRNA(Asn)/Glu-tRNA(Gln) amidotransferase GatCAB subunit B, partial [Candidatus Paceibacterota bacterium]|nr:Asp-tRNA(Asn)/Glu-tRNA(Gln) amidotransferase GatCAB subunit B [Candidatus Paceibacterota bacterium]
LAKNGGEPEKIIKERKLENIQDLSLFNKVIDKVLLANPKAVEDFKNGKITVLQFLIGQAMKELKGAANPQELSELIKKKIESQ